MTKQAKETSRQVEDMTIEDLFDLLEEWRTDDTRGYLLIAFDWDSFGSKVSEKGYPELGEMITRACCQDEDTLQMFKYIVEEAEERKKLGICAMSSYAYKQILERNKRLDKIKQNDDKG